MSTTTRAPVMIYAAPNFVPVDFQRLYNAAASARASTTLEYRFRTSTSEPPASGELRLDNVAQSTATTLWLSKTTDPGGDASLILGLLGTGSVLLIQDQNDSSSAQAYDVTGAPLDSGSYMTLPVTWREGRNPLANSQTVFVTLMATSSAAAITALEARIAALEARK